MRIIALAGLILLAGCMQHVLHQGNVLRPAVVMQIQEGDTRFHVESVLGTPMLKDVLHPRRVIYIEDFHDPDSGEAYRRRVEIVYDEAQRVVSIRMIGFGKKEN